MLVLELEGTEVDQQRHDDVSLRITLLLYFIIFHLRISV